MWRFTSSLRGVHLSRLGSPCRQLPALAAVNNYRPFRSDVRLTSSVPASTAKPAEPDSVVTPTEKDTTLYKDQNATWVDKYAPNALHPYLKLIRLDRPIGTYLVLLPASWGVALAAAPGGLPDPSLLALFVSGAFLMRGAGCTVNDMWDRRFDRAVARTRLRPLASGRLSFGKAFAFLAAQGVVGLGLLLQLNWPTIALGVCAVPLVSIYPALKRVTYFPQVALGLAMNYGILMAATATAAGAEAVAPSIGTALTTGTVSLDTMAHSLAAGFAFLPTMDWGATLPLYAGAAAWTVVYDTIYAHQDREEDASLGLRSTALWVGEAGSTPILGGLALAAGGCWAVAGGLAGLAWPYYAAVAASTGHMLWQVGTADLKDRINLTNRFVSNKWVGAAMFLGVVGGRLLG